MRLIKKNIEFVRKSLKENIYDILKNEIILGDLKPGYHLLENQLAKKFNVSKIPVREVLIRLEKEKFIKIIPYKGAIVRDVTIEEIENIYEMRIILEPIALEESFETISENKLMKLKEELLKFEDRRVNKKSKLDFLNLDIMFHSMLKQNSKNRLLVKLLYDFQLSSARWIKYSLPISSFKNNIEEHRKIIDYILDKNLESAKQELINHLNKAKERLITETKNKKFLKLNKVEPE